MSAEHPLRIAIAVQGRLHAFDLAKALAGCDDVAVRLLTNYSRRECAAFGFPDSCQLQHCTPHRWLQAAIFRSLRTPLPVWAERWIHTSFGRWAARSLAAQQPVPDVIRIFSGIATETLAHPMLRQSLRIVTRGSSHIRTQRQILDEEAQRAHCQLDHPSDYMMQREMAEYAAADQVLVLSSFARDSFLAEGHPKDRLWLLPNAVDPTWYAATPAMRASRRERLLSGKPLRVLTVGTFSYRKGIIDLAAVARDLQGQCEFRFVGNTLPEAKKMRSQMEADGCMEFRDRVPPQALREEYAWGDVFLFPTIEDGFPAVLSQALAAGLPTITTPNGSGPDVIVEGMNGWIVPPRAPLALIERLRWIDANRVPAATMAEAAADHIGARSWAQVAQAFVAGARTRLRARS